MPALFLVILVDLIGFGIVIPLLPFYAEHYGASPSQVTLLMATFSLAQFVVAPIWGALSDRFGRRPILLISLIGMSGSYVWLAYAGSFIELIVVRAVAGAMAANLSVAQAYIADITTPENRAKGMGLFGAAFSLGFIFGPVIGGVLAGPDPAAPAVQLPAFAGAAAAGLAFVLAVFILPESLPKERRAAAGARRPGRLKTLIDAVSLPGLGVLVILMFGVTFVFAGMESTFAIWSERQFGWGAQQTGYVFAYAGILAAIVQGGLIGRLTRMFGEAKLIVAGAVILGLGMAAIPLSVNLPLLLIAMALLAIGLSLLNPSLSSLISKAAPADAQGATLGVSQSASSLARIVGPAIAGASFQGLGRDAPYILGAVLMVLITLAAARLFTARRAS